MAEPNRRTMREDDLKAGNRPNQGADPLGTLTTDPFKFSAYNYPVDIETLSHALLFNINVNDRSSDIQSGGREQKAEGTYVDFQGREAPARADFQSRQSKLKEGKLGLERKYTRVKRAISLYVPDTVVFDNAQRYETPSLIEKLGIVGTSAVTGGGSSSPLTALKDAIRNASPAIGSPAITFLEGLLGGLSPGAAGALSATALGNIDRSYAVTAARTFATLSGYALNPVIEVLYSQPFLRTYNFEFVFSPRSQREADMVWQIIYEFRRHSAPEFAKNVSLNLTNDVKFSPGELGGLILIPPSEFDITFLRKTPSGFIENTNIPRMSTCVLSQVQVDYASSGSFVTFEDGMPVQTRMALSFIELNMITREAIDKGY